MKKIIKTSLVASLSLFLFNCSSDDSTPGNGGSDSFPKEKVYHLSGIEQNYYDIDAETMDKHLLHVNYKLDYDADFKLNKILYTDTGYTNNEVIREQSLEMLHTLDDRGRLQSFTFKEGASIVEEHTYTYSGDLLQSTKYDLIAQGGAFTTNFYYNEKKQLITAKAAETNLLVDYAYNDKNQIEKFKVNGQNIKVTYDDKVSPFYNLPFDLSSVLFNFNYAFPYTLKFPNNVTSFAFGNEVAEVEFTYNDANLPIKVIYYDGKKEDNLVSFDITYSYTIQEVEVRK